MNVNRNRCFLPFTLLGFWMLFQIQTTHANAQHQESSVIAVEVKTTSGKSIKVKEASDAFNAAVTNQLPSLEILNRGIESGQLLMDGNEWQLAQNVVDHCLKLPDVDKYPEQCIQLRFLSGKIELQKQNPELALEKLTHALDLSISQNNKKFLGHIYNNIGIAYWYLRNYPQAIDYFDDALELAEIQKDELLRLKTLTNKGLVYSQYANYKRAFECLFLASELANKRNDQNIEAILLNNLGNIYIQTKQYTKALISYQASKKIYNSLNDSIGMSICLNNIGEIHLMQNNSALALENYLSSLAILQQRHDTIQIASLYVNIGKVYHSNTQYQKAIKYYLDAIELSNKKDDHSLEAEINYQLGVTMMKMGSFIDAEKYLNRATTLSSQLGEKELQSKCLLALSETYENQSNYKKALDYKDQYARLKDTILNEQTIEHIARMDAIFRSLQKEKTIVELQEKNRIQELMIEKEETYRTIFIIISVFLALLALILFAAYQSKQRSNRRMAEVNRKLKKLNTTKDKFFSIISHDLKSPLNTILGYSEMMVLHAESGNTENTLEYSQMVHSSSKKLFALVDNLLHWSRTQVGSTKHNPEVIDVSIQCSNIISLLRLSSEEKDILLSGKIEPELMAYADVNLFNTVMRNLISNAIKFTRVGGTITVNAKKMDDYIEVSIADSGIGISSVNLEKLFKIDENISTHGTFQEKGTGLGLVLSKEFVVLNKGSIWAESEIEKGSTFYFTVPLAKH